MPRYPFEHTGKDSWMDKRGGGLQDAEEHESDAAFDTETNELKRGAGRTCPLCHRVIERGQEVRKRVDGSYQHEVCPLHP